MLLFSALILFVVCILMVIVGKGVRDKFLGMDEHETKGGVNALLGALFGLWGFILAFTFGNVSTRFENVRASIVEEANIIRTVILRVETFPDSIQVGLREDVKKYLQPVKQSAFMKPTLNFLLNLFQVFSG